MGFFSRPSSISRAGTRRVPALSRLKSGLSATQTLNFPSLLRAAGLPQGTAGALGLHSPGGSRSSKPCAGSSRAGPAGGAPSGDSPARAEALPPLLLPPGEERSEEMRSGAESADPPAPPAIPSAPPASAPPVSPSAPPAFPFSTFPSTPLVSSLASSPPTSSSPPQHPLSPLNSRSISFFPPISTIPSAPP